MILVSGRTSCWENWDFYPIFDELKILSRWRVKSLTTSLLSRSDPNFEFPANPGNLLQVGNEYTKNLNMTTSFPALTQWEYDVFISFRGEDTRKGFTDYLYTAFDDQGIKTFRDDPELQKGEAIAPALSAAIEKSRFSVIVLSPNFASSTWCLNELVHILECMKANPVDASSSGRVLPIFYDVDPSEVRKQTGSFGDAFSNHEKRFWDDNKNVQRWRSALHEVANFSGWASKEWRYERELIRDIVEDILKKVQPAAFSIAENLVGMESRLQPVFLHLGLGVDDVRFIGIWGMGGIGKTTMVTEVYERISHEFDCSYLLTNVRASVEKDGLLNLQKQFLSGMMEREKAYNILNSHEGATALKRRLGRKRVLLILDDVNQSEHLQYLAGNADWFGSGSRVLITTRNEHLLIQHEVERRLKVEELNEVDSLKLFSKKAFKKDYPQEEFLGLSESVISYAQGLPLALEVLGSSLYSRDLSEWKSLLGKLGRVCNLKIFDILKISYNDLDPEEKKIFLDIACFFNEQDKDQITEILTCFDFAATIGIKVLMDRSLLTLSHGTLRMHDLVREMGQEIVHMQSPNNPGKRSRLWLYKDVKHVLTHNIGTEAIEGILLDSTEWEAQVDATPISFSMMHELRYLKIKNVNLPKGLEYLPNGLCILDWTRYPLTSLPGTEPLHKLKSINLSHSPHLVSTPNFKVMPYLEFLYLEGCIRLNDIDTGIEVLERLTVLTLKGCQNLVRLPSNVRGLKSLKVLNLSGCSKLDKLPDELGQIRCLEKLDVSGSGIIGVPSSIGFLKNLQELSLAGCKPRSLKPWNMMLNPLQLLRKQGLSLPCLSGLHSLTYLNLSDCNLSDEAVPVDFGCLASLKGLNLRNNQFVRLPESIDQLSRLELLYLDGCSKLQRVPELSSHAWVHATNCTSLDTVVNQIGRSNLLPRGLYTNSFKKGENESVSRVLTRHLASKATYHKSTTLFIGPGNEIPEWYNHRGEGSSITIELHPGWFTDTCMGFALCVVFDSLNPLPPLVEWCLKWSMTTNGKPWNVGERYGDPSFGGEYGQPVGDHIWFFYLSHDFFRGDFQDIHYQLKFSFKPIFITRRPALETVRVKKCGFRIVYEKDSEELQQTYSKQSDNNKRGLQLLCDDVASSSIAGQDHPERIKVCLMVM